MMKNFRLCYFAAMLALSLSHFHASGATISGQITCEGKGVKGVAVSDGYAVTTTDADGKYVFDSDKKNGYVFYTIPSGYEPFTENSAEAFKPSFWARLNSPVEQNETHNFALKKVQNDNFSMIIGADIHLADRLNDLKVFKKLFMSSINRLVNADPSRHFYSMFLGDISWDAHWYKNNYDLSSVLSTLKQDKYPVLLFPVMGNHDNDAATPADENTDFNASGAYRRIMAPSYYSFNIGKVHFISLDNIVYKNSPNPEKKFNKGVVGERNYEARITPEQIEWLKKDLELVADKSAPIIIGMHIPSWRIYPSNGFETYPSLKGNSNEALADALKDFANVTIVSGHTHYMYHAHPADHKNIREDNIASLAATMWNTSQFNTRHICTDGTPGGYALYEFNGKECTKRYISIDPIDSIGNKQFRAYDMNSVREVYQTDPRFKKLLHKLPKRIDYSNIADNTILLNVFNYDIDWKIEILENGVAIPVKRIATEDPLHTLCLDVKIIAKKKKKLGGSASNPSNFHMFEAVASSPSSTLTIKVTDSFGNVYTEEMVRPKQFCVDMK